MAINPPYRLSPIENIVNVRWGGDFCWIIGPRGSPTMIAQMVRSGGNGPQVDIPTDTFSPNCDIFIAANPPGIPFNSLTHVIGNSLDLSFPQPVLIDWRGYAEMTLREFSVTTAPSGQTSAIQVETGDKLLLNRAGEEIDEIPADPAQEFGGVVTSDEEGTVYALGTAATGGLCRLTKYDGDMNQLWQKQFYHTFYYDSDLQQIISTFVGSSFWFKDWFDLSGAMVNTLDGPELDSIAPVTSRNGQVFITNSVLSPDSTEEQFTFTNELRGYDREGEATFTIPAPNAFDGSPNPEIIIPLGETRFVVVARASTDEGDITSGRTEGLKTFVNIHNAETGEKISGEQWDGEMIIFSQNTTLVNPPPTHETNNQRDESPQSFVQRTNRGFYWPLSDWPEPPDSDSA